MSKSDTPSNWQVALLRLTAFPVPDAQLLQQDFDWWRTVVGESADTKISENKGNKIGEQGTFEKGVLQLIIQPRRIDWHYSVDENEIRESDKIPTLDAFQNALQVFKDIMVKWLALQTIPPIMRLAFGAVLLQPVEGRKEGYVQLSSYLPFNLDGENSSDFIYQINRPRLSQTYPDGLIINRLTKWSVLQVKRVIAPLARDYPQTDELYATRLELDINTSAEFDGVFNLSDLRTIFEELIELGVEIAVEGDKN
jgi:hypothetical protein